MTKATALGCRSSQQGRAAGLLHALRPGFVPNTTRKAVLNLRASETARLENLGPTLQLTALKKSTNCSELSYGMHAHTQLKTCDLAKSKGASPSRLCFPCQRSTPIGDQDCSHSPWGDAHLDRHISGTRFHNLKNNSVSMVHVCMYRHIGTWYTCVHGMHVACICVQAYVYLA